MRSIIRFIVGLLMPLVLIVGGGMVIGWGISNDWEFVTYAGLGMIGAGILWGLFLFFWASEGGW